MADPANFKALTNRHSGQSHTSAYLLNFTRQPMHMLWLRNRCALKQLLGYEHFQKLAYI